MIGAVPDTEWLKDWIQLDSKGYIITDPRPFLETSQAGVFAVGDVRAGSAKRVAAAVGEGSVVVQYVHNYLSPVGSKERMRKGQRNASFKG